MKLFSGEEDGICGRADRFDPTNISFHGCKSLVRSEWEGRSYTWRL